MEVHNTSDNEKYNIKAQDSAIGTNSLQLKKINLNQIPSDPRKQNSYFLCVKENLIIFDESFSKTFHGGLKDLKKKPRLIKHKCHEIGVEHDRFLAALYSVYITKVEGFAESVESFYFRPHRKGTFEYEKSAVGLCTLNKILPEKLCLKANLPRKTAHCLRITCATRLFQHNVARERTGHKSNALFSYQKPS